MTIKNLQRQSYFIEQEMKRKKVLITAVKKEIAEEKKTKHLKNALMNKVKKNVRCSRVALFCIIVS